MRLTTRPRHSPWSLARALHFSGLLAALSLLVPHSTARGQDREFPPGPEWRIELPPLPDDDLRTMFEVLDHNLDLHREEANFPRQARFVLWRFLLRVQSSRITAEQEEQILAHLAELTERHPTLEEVLERARTTILHLVPGKEAPELRGKSVGGEDLDLADCRGKVTLVVFGADWCTACTAEAPYHRFLRERYAGQPFAILGVNSDDEERARKYEAEHGYPCLWDGPVQQQGPLTRAFNVVAWPSVYLIDAHGVVRFVLLRGEDLLKATAQLMEERAREG